MRYLVLLVLVNQIQDISNLQFPGRTRREEPTTGVKFLFKAFGKLINSVLLRLTNY